MIPSLAFFVAIVPCVYRERYRDLIDAADSIEDMQKCSEQVRGHLFLVQHLPRSLQLNVYVRAGFCRIFQNEEFSLQKPTLYIYC